MIAQIFSVGTEILLGNITDTNSQFIARELMEYGIDVHKMVTVGDNYHRLYKEMKEADENVDYIVVSGGLGPTQDDITKEVAIKVAGKENMVEINQKVLENLKKHFNNKKTAVDNNLKQALFPRDAIVLDNDIGTAPGCIITSKNNTKIILLPGPPNEIKKMFNEKLKPHLNKESVIESRIVKIGILGEWDMARQVDLSGSNPTLSPYFDNEGAFLRITAKADSYEEAMEMIEEKDLELQKIFGDLIIARDDTRKEATLIDLLKSRNEYVATAESITGGMIASSIIDIDGASEVLKESYITYSNQAKEKILNVSHETLEKYTAVSRQAAYEMMDGLYQKTGADLCIIATGYAHLGLVYLGIKYKDIRFVKEFNFTGDRNRVRLRAKNKAIDTSVIIMRGNYESYFSI
jgi:nicotinamide-nucleotide amidase